MELGEFKQVVRDMARAQAGEAERFYKLVRYRDAAEACVRAFAEIDSNEQGALVLGRILGIRAMDRDIRPELRLQQRMREWKRDNPLPAEIEWDEMLRAFSADERNKEALRDWQRTQSEPAKPWLLAALDAYKGPYANEGKRATERRILLELGATPNEIAAFQDSTSDEVYERSGLSSYGDSATTRAARRLATQLRQKLGRDLIDLKRQRQRQRQALLACDRKPNMQLARTFHTLAISQLDEQIASKEETLARLNARGRS